MRRTQAMLGVLGVLALLGGGTALAATGKGGSQKLRPGFVGHRFHGPGQLLDAAASYLGLQSSDIASQLRGGKTLAQVAAATQGKTVQGLIDALVGAEKKTLADAVAAKRLTQAQADRIAQELPQRTADFVNGTFRGHGAPFGFRHGRDDDLQAAAGYLGTTVASLLSQLVGGKTLASIANATPDKSASGLVAALVAHEKAEHPQATTDELTTRFTDLVNNAFPRHPGLGPHFFRHR
jgi:hypothetical protein